MFFFIVFILRFFSTLFGMDLLILQIKQTNMKHLFLLISCLMVLTTDAQTQVTLLPVRSAGFKAGANMEAKGDSNRMVRFVVSDRGQVPFVQSCISRDTQRALQAPDASKPYFKVREALPIPAAYTPTEQGGIVGLDEGVYAHAHSPGFEILPNGDVFAIDTTILSRIL